MQAALGDLGGEAPLARLCDTLSGTAHAARSPHFREKIRQAVQRYPDFEPAGSARRRSTRAAA